MGSERNTRNSTYLYHITPSRDRARARPRPSQQTPPTPPDQDLPHPRSTPASSDRRTLAARTSRDAAERLVALASHLAPHDRLLVHAVFADGRTVADVARLSGRTPRSVRGRLARLIARIADPVFTWLVVHENALPPDQRTVACATILQGRRLQDVARERGLTYHEARAMRQAVVSLAKSGIVAGSPATWRASRPAARRASRTGPTQRPRAQWRTRADTIDTTNPHNSSNDRGETL